jgi:hypothetical protein
MAYPVTPWTRIAATGAEDASDNPITTPGTAVHHVRDSITGTEHAVTGTITYEIDEGGLPYLQPTTGAYITAVLPSTIQWNAGSFLSVFEPASVLLPNNSFVSIWSSTTTTAGAQIRWTVATAGAVASTATGGILLVNEGTTRQIVKRGSGIYSAGELATTRYPIHCRNIVATRVSTTHRVYINSTDLEVTSAATSNTGTFDTIYLFRHNTTPSIDFAGGRFYEWSSWNSVLTDQQLKDSLTAARTDYPFFTPVDPNVPLILLHGSSFTFGYGTATASTWWRYVQANFGKSVQMFVFGGPQEGINDVYNEYLALIQPIKASLPKRTTVWFEGQINRIRTDTQTAATTLAETVTFANAIASDFPSGYAVSMNTMPRTTRNVQLEEFDPLLAAYCSGTQTVTNAYRGNGTDISSRFFMVDMRILANVGGDGDNTTGAQAQWANSAPDGIVPNNVRWFYNADAVHMNGYDDAHPGQLYLALNVLPIFRYLTRPYAQR